MARQTATYIYGSTARQLQTAPLRREEIERSRQVQRRPETRVRRKAKVDKVAVFLVCLTFMAVMATSIIYLRIKFQSTYLNKSVVNLQSEIVKMEKENAAALKDLDNSLDLTAVYDKATKKLGMVAAKENQIFTYKSRKSTQVRTHGDIPSE